MSVAFRRDGDEEHLEPRFEIPIPPGPNRVTARGLAQIRARVAGLERAIGAAAGDEAALTALRRDLRYWQTREITAELVPAPAGDVVAFGTTVRFRLNGQDRTITLVGDDEADPAAGLVAFSAPLARALGDAEVGDVLPFGGRDEAIEVIAITVPDEDGAA
ncbi:GreA/GreB family elongation factor [Novosphingobium piscinae]|uniref:GreA/GreB family elongation factor n=1 Tax=Novosphingobium piscinae TaxID=1507448 RepID=A0A7X1FWQ4_9SPHN|nr:GreA/GreB family elongation factor [Novosphingobium piscinae]MBC2668420.1 GreA/GreB family elongation factor [Novosphingobium piscinae]